MKCKYCNGDCPESDKNNTDFMCDGYLGDIDNLYKGVHHPSMSDSINPSYYRKGIETTDYIQSHSMNYLEGNIIKYVTRHRAKGGLEDLKKAEWYLTRLIKQEEKR